MSEASNLHLLIHAAVISAALLTPGCSRRAPSGPGPSDPPDVVGATPEKPAPIPKTSDGTWTPFVCADIRAGFATHLAPGSPIDYLSVRSTHEGADPTIRSAKGDTCATATDTAGCQTKLSNVHDPFIATRCVQICVEVSVVTTAGDTVQRHTDATQLTALLTPIDTPQEAHLLASLGPIPDIGCDETGAWRETPTGYELRGRHRTSDCPITHDEVVSRVERDGTFTELSRTALPGSGACIGRLPEGICTYPERMTSLPSFLAESARLEAAAVFAFERLALELAEAGAPDDLVQRARTAAADEVRHAEVMRRLAEGEGAIVTPPERPETPSRTLEEVALENAVEGCVRETLGAAIGLYQAQHAERHDIRTAMGPVAEEEMAHACLSWDVHAWLMTQLSPEAQTRVEAARAMAVVRLRPQRGTAWDPTLGSALGMPPPAAAAQLFRSLEPIWG